MNRTCQKFRKLIHDELDGDLRPDDGAPLQDHLAACAVCRDYQAQMLHLSAAIRALPLHDIPIQSSQLARLAAASSAAPGVWEVARGLARQTSGGLASAWAYPLRGQRRLLHLLVAVLLAVALGWTGLIVFSAAGFLLMGIEGARLVWTLAQPLVEVLKVSVTALALAGSSLLPAFGALGALEAAALLAWLALRRRRAAAPLLI